MFTSAAPNSTGLSGASVNALALKNIINVTPFPAYSREYRRDWTLPEWRAMKHAWKNFTGPVINPSNFSFVVLDDTHITYDSGRISIDYIEEDEENALPPVQPLKAAIRISPNSKCPCGSNRKFKKCHGRFQNA